MLTHCPFTTACCITPHSDDKIPSLHEVCHSKINKTPRGKQGCFLVYSCWIKSNKDTNTQTYYALPHSPVMENTPTFSGFYPCNPNTWICKKNVLPLFIILIETIERTDRLLFIIAEFCWERTWLLGSLTNLSPISKTLLTLQFHLVPAYITKTRECNFYLAFKQS